MALHCKPCLCYLWQHANLDYLAMLDFNFFLLWKFLLLDIILWTLLNIILWTFRNILDMAQHVALLLQDLGLSELVSWLVHSPLLLVGWKLSALNLPTGLFLKAMKGAGTSTGWNISPVLEIHSKMNEFVCGQILTLIIKRIQWIMSGKAPNSYIAKEHESYLSSSVFYKNVDFNLPQVFRCFLGLLPAVVLIFVGISLWSLWFKQYWLILIFMLWTT